MKPLRRLATALALTLALGVATAQALPSPLLDIDFDGLAEGRLPAGVTVHTQFPRPDVVPGVVGAAWRSDGFSSYAEAALSLDPEAAFTLSLWVALESYPSDREVPLGEIAPSSIVQQASGGEGFDIFIDTFGRWGMRLATSAGGLIVRAPQRFPLRRWSHLVATVDPAAGAMALYLDGNLIGLAKGQPGMRLCLAPVPLKLATPAVPARILDFTINRLNGAFDLLSVHPGALQAGQLALLPGPPGGRVPSAEASLQVPQTRFAADTLRPRVHPMPPANWTNEPHGLVYFNDVWHLFYQRTPNGPFKTQMHWGHLSSRDLVVWESQPDALRPELHGDDVGHDMKGIWSGHVIVDGGKAFAFYTSVNHGDRLAAGNPGISMAVSQDPLLRDWRKLGPILNSEGLVDFRDPFLWKQDGTWHMLIGAALEAGGGLDYQILRPGPDGARWERQRRFSEISYRVLDPGSVIWEMPVFEPLSGTVWILLVNPIGGRISKYGDPATRAVYWTGEWSGGVFKPFFRDPKPLDLLPGHLAPTVARAPDGHLRAIGIIDERRSPRSQQRAGWANMFSLPRVWRLLPDGRTLGQELAPELTALRAAPRIAAARVSLGTTPVAVDAGLRAYELLLDLDAEAPRRAITVELMASPDGSEVTRLQFDPARDRVVFDKSRSSLSGEGEGPLVLEGAYDANAFGPMRRLRVVVDGSSIEVFVNDAAAYAVRSYPSLSVSTGLRIGGADAGVETATLSLWPLRLPPPPPGAASSTLATDTPAPSRPHD